MTLIDVSFLVTPAVVNIDGDIFILYHNLLFHTEGFKIVQLKTLKAFVGGVCYMYIWKENWEKHWNWNFRIKCIIIKCNINGSPFQEHFYVYISLYSHTWVLSNYHPKLEISEYATNCLPLWLMWKMGVEGGHAKSQQGKWGCVAIDVGHYCKKQCQIILDCQP